MAQSFGIPQLVEYLNQMGLKISSIDEQQELLEDVAAALERLGGSSGDEQGNETGS